MWLQLYAQASGVDFFLKSKVKEWAMGSAGLFPAVSACPSRFVRWADVAGTKHESHVAWAALKSTRRAMEKLHRAYDGDVSLLLDVCRQMVVFERVDDLVTCLELILADQDVHVERIKNYMDERYDAEASAGYRLASTLV